MIRKNDLTNVIAMALAINGVNSAASAQEAQGDTGGSGLTVEEIIVTATKRSRSLQDVAVAVQAISASTIDEVGINNFTDYVAFLPNVAFAGQGPGQNEVFIRGIATDRGSLKQAGGTTAGPTVAMYLDEAPITAAGRNIDLYITDMSRIEVLPGPQGTLFGGSSQAGTVRLITNKPEINEMSARVQTSLSYTEQGEEGYSAEGYINLPVIDDKMAVRVTAYHAKQGGYIDNVPGTASFGSERFRELSPHYASNPERFANTTFGVNDNAALVEDNINDTLYEGVRIGVKYDFNDDWKLLVQYMNQKLEVDGVFDYDPEVGVLQTQRFSPDRLDDKTQQFSWTLEGRVGELDLIYTGSFLEHDVDQTVDYVEYTLTGFYQPIYNCQGVGGSLFAPDEFTHCEAPEQFYFGRERFNRNTHEFRFSTDADNRLSFIGGVYYEKTDSGVSQEWSYPGSIAVGFAPNAPISTSTINDIGSNPRPPGVVFFNDLTVDLEQLSFFGEATYRFNDQLSLTAGARHYDIDQSVEGSANFGSFGTDGDSGANLNENLEPSSDSSTIFKFTLDYRLNDDVLLYGTFSQGFRHGGFNRLPMTGNDGTVIPGSFLSDTINNYEFGWKTTLMDGRMQFNGSVYWIDWNDIQITVFDQDISFLLFTKNAGKARVKGIEGDFTFRATENLTISSAFSFNDTELVDKPVNFDTIIDVGERLSLTPKFQGNIRARYDVDIGDGNGYAMFAVNHRGSSFNSATKDDRREMPAYTIANAAFVWTPTPSVDIQFSVNNVFDKRATTFVNLENDIPGIVVNRPRNYSVTLSYRFN